MTKITAQDVVNAINLFHKCEFNEGKESAGRTVKSVVNSYINRCMDHAREQARRKEEIKQLTEAIDEGIDMLAECGYLTVIVKSWKCTSKSTN
jgi:hypothetical protein